MLADGRLWRVQLDTYERETERYGGDLGIEPAERVFAADSDAVLRILGAVSGDVGLDLRWRLALLGMDLLFDDLGLSALEKRTAARAAREAFGREFRIDGGFRNAVGKRFRTERARLEALLAAGPDPDPDSGGGPRSPLAEGIRALRDRSAHVAPATRELRQLAAAGQLTEPLPELAASFVHMHVNRLLRSAQRAQELVLYELLDRAYTARSAWNGAP
jgi:thiopeptide-type bacteriocin biosynthesis protein